MSRLPYYYNDNEPYYEQYYDYPQPSRLHYQQPAQNQIFGIPTPPPKIQESFSAYTYSPQPPLYESRFAKERWGFLADVYVPPQAPVPLGVVSDMEYIQFGTDGPYKKYTLKKRILQNSEERVIQSTYPNRR